MRKHVRNYILCNLFISFSPAPAITCRFSHLLRTHTPTHTHTHTQSALGTRRVHSRLMDFVSVRSFRMKQQIMCDVLFHFQRMMFVFLGLVSRRANGEDGGSGGCERCE